jgi:hypothetical protein
MPRAGRNADGGWQARPDQGVPEPGRPAASHPVSYALARRAVLAGLARGQIAAAEVCDAHPDLLRAARYYGEATDRRCPVCRNDRLTRVTYAYGDELQHASGRARSSRTLPALAARVGRARVYEVEVCRSCGWNHLAETFVIGTDVGATPAGEASGPSTGRARSAPLEEPPPPRRPAPRRPRG